MDRNSGWVLVVLLLCLQISVRAQPSQPPPEGQLKIDVEEGANETVHHPGELFHKEIKILVTDELGRPVPDANVTFTTKPSESRAGAETLKNETQVLAVTDANGEASAGQLQANRFEGRYSIAAKAEFYGKTSTVPINEVNKKPKWYRRKGTWITVGSIAAGSLAAILVVRAEQKPSATISTVTPTGPVTHP